jgi:hypothetical protein
MIEEVKMDWNPMLTDKKDIFAHKIARAFWVRYRSGHIISQDGLPYLEERCREIIRDKVTFDNESAKKYLVSFDREMSMIEHSMYNPNTEWIDKTIPFLTGESEIKLVIKDK